MDMKVYGATLARHFAIIGAVLAVFAAISGLWKEAPWWAYLGILAMAPLTALLPRGAASLWTSYLIRRGDRLNFPAGTVAQLGKALADLLGAVRTKQAGLEVRKYDPNKVPAWVDRVLKALHDTLKQADPLLPEDAHVVWLRAAEDCQSISPKAHCNADPAYIAAHIPFAKGDGLAGKVWESGEPAAHSASRPHPSWQSRPGCNNASYVCVPVGGKGGPGGVLGLGSDTGFEVTKAHTVVLEVFAPLLALAAEAE